MIKNLDKFKKVKLIDSITHQNIGGKEFVIEKQGTLKDILDMENGMMNIAIFNFVRRNNWFIANDNEDEKVYYGHVIETNLGYWVLESEIESELVYE